MRRHYLLPLTIMVVALFALVLMTATPRTLAVSPTPAAPQTIGRVPITPTYSTVVITGFNFYNDGRAFLHLKSTYTGTTYVTVTTPYQVEGFDLSDLTFSLPASSERMVGPFQVALFNASDTTHSNFTHVDFSQATSVTIAALRY